MPSSKGYVLVVDDVPDGREMLTEYLQFRGFRVVTAENGARALEIARKRRPRVILMDLSMPGVDGWEATRQLKTDPHTRNVIVIAVTAHALLPDEANARSAGCDGFIAKPYDLSSLADALGQIMLRGHAALDTLAPVQHSSASFRKGRTVEAS